jgi:hypothetical protein
VSPDGRWAVAVVPSTDEENTTSTTAFAVDGGAAVPLCVAYCQFLWDVTGRFVYYSESRTSTYTIPVMEKAGLPKIPPQGIASLEDITKTKTGPAITQYVQSAMGASVYAYVRETTRRNLYRIPLQ